VESTQRTAKVYLPEGSWYDFFTGRRYEGGQEIFTDSPLEKLPVFAKGGSIIPMQNIIQSTSQMPSDTLYLHVYYADRGSAFILYEDDGLTYDYEAGKFGTRKIEFDPAGKAITIGKVEGKFSSRLSKVCLILHGFDNVTGKLNVDGVEIGLDIATIDLYTALGDNDPLYLGGKKYPQEVKKCTFNLVTGKGTQISW
jgi:alpha-glucosidase